MRASAKNMEAVYKAKQHHDENCPWGGEGKRVLMHPYDIERTGWEEGDVIAGLTIISDPAINPSMFRVECDAEPSSDGERLEEEVSKEDLVSV